MANIGAGYDLSVSTISPDGRVFQVEYAAKATDNGSTTLAIVCKNGVLFAAEKQFLNKMVVPGSSPRIFAVDTHVALSVAGFLADGKEIVRRARLEAKEYRKVYDEPIPGHVLAERVALFFHAYTLAWSERPFGCSVLLGAYEPDVSAKSRKPEFSLYSIDTAGTCYKYFGTALGKGKQIAKTEIERLKLSELTCEDALIHVAKAMHKVHEETRDISIDLEVAWISETSHFKFKMLDSNVVKHVYNDAVHQLEASEDIRME